MGYSFLNSFVLQLIQIFCPQPTPLPRRQIRRQFQTADARTVQTFNPVAHCGHHALDLVVLAFGQGQAQMQPLGVWAHHFAGCSTHGFGVIVEHHTVQQALHLFGIQRVLDGDLVHLGQVLLGRTHAVDELAIVA